MSCVFCPTAFCSEHHHGNMRLTEYYQLACQKHDDIALCEDPSVLKIFGLCKTPKGSSSRKPLRRKSSGGVKRTRGDGDDAELGNEDHTLLEIRTPKSKRKSSTPVSEARERTVKRSCRDRDAKKTDLNPTVSSDELLTRLGKAADDVKRPRPRKEQQRDERHGRLESEMGRKRNYSSEKDRKTVRSDSSLISEGLKKGKKSTDTFHDRHQQAVDLEGTRKTKKTSEAFARDHSQHRKRQRDVHHRVQKLRQMKHADLTDASDTTSLNFTSSAAAKSLSPPLLLADPSRTTGVDSRSSGKSVANSAVTSAAKSLVDEPLFDNSDDEFPELVIDFP